MTTFTARGAVLVRGLSTRLTSAARALCSPGSIRWGFGWSLGTVSTGRGRYPWLLSGHSRCSVDRTEGVASVTRRAPIRITAESWQNSSAMSAPHSSGSR